MKTIKLKLTANKSLSVDYSVINTQSERKRITREIMGQKSHISFRLPKTKTIVVTQTVMQRKALERIERKAEMSEQRYYQSLPKIHQQAYYATNIDGMKTIVFINQLN